MRGAKACQPLSRTHGDDVTMGRRRRRGQRTKGEETLEAIRARQRSWVAIPLAEWLEEEGLVVIKAPRFQGRAGRRLVDLMGREQTYNLRLDEFGSFVWRLVDGKRDLGEITDATVDKMGAEEETALHRLLMFMRSLRNVGVVRVVVPENLEVDYK